MVFEIKNGTSVYSQYVFLLPSSPEVWLVTLFGGQGISPHVIYFQKLSDNAWDWDSTFETKCLLSRATLVWEDKHLSRQQQSATVQLHWLWKVYDDTVTMMTGDAPLLSFPTVTLWAEHFNPVDVCCSLWTENLWRWAISIPAAVVVCL